MDVRTEEFDGLTFEHPTWDPTPVAWNQGGSWAKDPALTERLMDGIRAAVPDHEALAAQGWSAPTAGDSTWCRTYWGSHGCDLPEGHGGLHVCGELGQRCSAGLKYGDSDTLILWWATGDRFRLSAHHWTWFE